MWRIIYLLFIFALVLSLVACVSSDTEIERKQLYNTENSVSKNSKLATKDAIDDISTKNSLVVYFSIPETTQPDNITREEYDSAVVIDGKILGNT